MRVVVIVLLFESLPLSVLASVVFGCTLRRRSWFWLRLVGVVAVMLMPDLGALLARPDEQAAGALLWLGFAWGLLLIVPARFLLFAGQGRDPGPGDQGGEGPDPGDDRPTPPAPLGGIPLPDATPSSRRLRDHRPPRFGTRRTRPARRPERTPSRLWHPRLWPS